MAREEEDAFVKVGRMGMLRAYLMKSFSEGRKSGYDIMREVKEKTGGRWKPSKGALYPLITEMESRGMIRVVEKGARGMKKYTLTERGRKAFGDFRKRMIHIGQHHEALGGLLGNVFEGMDEEVYRMMLKARHDILEKMAGPKRAKVKALMKKFVAELGKI
ncbi:MAG: PadR family transcriptional regulator [Candidatus Micrarchaeia archaeon]|jgi:DNA-binding PadR family transcriptional regulator